MESELSKEMEGDSLVSLENHPHKLLIKLDSIKMATKINEYDNKRSKALKWGYLLQGSFIVFIVFLGRIFFLQHTNVDNIEKNFISSNYREASNQSSQR